MEVNVWLPPPEGAMCSFIVAHWGEPEPAVAMVCWPNKTQHNPGRIYYMCHVHKHNATIKHGTGATNGQDSQANASHLHGGESTTPRDDRH